MVVMFGHIKNRGKNKMLTPLNILIIAAALLVGLNIVDSNINESRYRKQQLKSTEISSEEHEITKTKKQLYILNDCVSKYKPDEASRDFKQYTRGNKVKTIAIVDNEWFRLESGDYIACRNTIEPSNAFIDKAGTMITSVKPDGTIECDGDISDKILNYAYNYWYLIPENIREDFKENNWTIVLTTESISKMVNTTYKVSGVTLTDEKRIIIEGTQSCIRRALIHEVGHYIDYRDSFISRQSDFKKRFDENGQKLKEYNSNYTDINYGVEEYFAELYNEAFVGNSVTKFVFKDDIDYVLNASYAL